MLVTRYKNAVSDYIIAFGGKARLAKAIIRIEGLAPHPQSIYSWMKNGRVPNYYKPTLEKIVAESTRPIKIEIKQAFLASIELYPLNDPDETYPDTPFCKEMLKVGYRKNKSAALSWLNGELKERGIERVTHLEMYNWMRAGKVTNGYRKDEIYDVLEVHETPTEKELLGLK